jgi:hypothetical protein
MGWYGLDWFGSCQGPAEGSCEPSGSTICCEISEWPSDSRLLKKGAHLHGVS